MIVKPLGKVPRVGYVLARVSSADQRLWDEARQGLKELGYVEGRNITLEIRWAESKGNTCPLRRPAPRGWPPAPRT